MESHVSEPLESDVSEPIESRVNESLDSDVSEPIIKSHVSEPVETDTRIAFKKARSGSFSILYYDHTILEIYSFFKQINLYASGF